LRALRHAPATIGVIIAILIVFGAEIASGVAPFNLQQDDLARLDALGAINSEIAFHDQWWRLLTAMFLHVGLLHLMLNLWALFQLGYLFEMIFGSWRFLLTYFVAGLAASYSSFLNIGPFGLSAGASGAIFGILGALIISLRRSPVWRHEPWARGLIRQLVIWAGINIVIGFSFPAIDNAAHLGGFAAGLVLGLLPHRAPPPPPSTVVIEAGAEEPPNRREA
jgi:rhomboid protease GluP